MGRRALGWLAVLVGLLLGGAQARSAGWVRVGTALGPAPFVLEVVATDLDRDGTPELVLAGRHYERQTDRLFVLGCTGRGPACGFEVLGSSPPFVGPLAHLTLAPGDFLGQGRREVLSARGSRLELWIWDGGRLRSVWDGMAPAPVEQAAFLTLEGRWPAVAFAVVKTQPRYRKELAVHRWRWAEGLDSLEQQAAVGLVRAMTAVDLMGDGQSEIVLEAGEGSRPGVVEVWRWDGTAFARATSTRLRAAPVFALARVPGRLAAGRPVPDGTALAAPPPPDGVLVADNRGGVAVYRWNRDGFARVGDQAQLGWNLVSAAAGDFNGDGVLEAVVVEYPNVLHRLQWRP